MKSIFSSKISLFFTALLASIFIVMACGKIEDLTKDVELKVDGDIIQIPVSLQFIDTQDSIAPDVEITLLGADATKLYTSIADRDFQVTGGVIDLAVKKGDAPDPKAGKKLDFTVVAKSKSGKYLRTVRNIIISDTGTQFVTIPMVNLDKLPSGVTKATGTVNVGANGAVATTKVATTGTEKLEITIPAGTKMYDAAGIELKGTVNVQALRFSGADTEANSNTLAAFPGGFEVNKAVDETGKALPEGSFITAGFIAVDMEVDGKAVKTFSGTGIGVFMDVSAGIKDDKGVLLKVGDQIPVWSLNETDGSWKKETTVTLAGTASNLTASYAQNHLSFWNLDLFFGGCRGSLITIPSNVRAGSYYVEIIRGNGDGRVLTSRYMSIAPGQQIQFGYPPQGNFQLKLYAGSAFCRGSLAYRTSSDFQMCASNTTVSLAAVTTSTTISISVFVSGTCRSRPGIAINPNLTVYYRQAGCAQWAALGGMRGGFLLSQGVLVAGTSYDFKVAMGGTTFYFYSKTVPNQPRYSFPNIAIPATYCRQLF